MPTNLNALIRYKEIDRCLRNRYVHCTIKRMQESCSEQLAEFRAVYKLVSERTIRDDIKTLRSDALGFNAPIVVKDGIYSYSDENYSIFKEEIDEIELLIDIAKLLQEEKNNISNSKLDVILSKLKIKLGDKFPEIKAIDKEEDIIANFDIGVTHNTQESFSIDEEREVIRYQRDIEIKSAHPHKFKKAKALKRELFTWAEILEIL